MGPYGQMTKELSSIAVDLDLTLQVYELAAIAFVVQMPESRDTAVVKQLYDKIAQSLACFGVGPLGLSCIVLGIKEDGFASPVDIEPGP